MVYSLLRPLIFRLDAEQAHGVALDALKTTPSSLLASPPRPDPALAMDVAGITFPNPVGMAAGFDKNGEVPDALLRSGLRNWAASPRAHRRAIPNRACSALPRIAPSSTAWVSTTKAPQRSRPA